MYDPCISSRLSLIHILQVTPALLDELSGKCSEFLIHAVDVEGKASGIETELAKMLGAWDGICLLYTSRCV